MVQTHGPGNGENGGLQDGACSGQLGGRPIGRGQTPRRACALIPAVGLAAAGWLALAGCTPANERERQRYADALSQHFAQTGQLCLAVNFWPVYTAPESDRRQAYVRPVTLRHMEALKAAGMAADEATVIQDRDFYNYLIEIDARRFTLTPAALPYLFAAGPRQLPDLCWGQKVLHRVVDWKAAEVNIPRNPDGTPNRTAPAQPQRVLVTYTYDIARPAQWATQAAVQTAFPEVEVALRNTRVGQAGLILEKVSEQEGGRWRVVGGGR
jgi:hypothetical protein